jgi:site-specific recombinase XerD
MIEALELRGMSPKTTRLYVDCVARLARYYNNSPGVLDAEQIRVYLLYLVHERKVAWSTYRQALSALRFLYRDLLKRGEVVQDIRAPRPRRQLPVVLSFEEVHRFFAAIPSFKHRTLLMLSYAAGLRVSEAAALRSRTSTASGWCCGSSRGSGTRIVTRSCRR